MRNRLKKIAQRTAQTLGIQRITFRDLGKATNIKSSSVFYHFGSKDKLLLEIVQDYKDEFMLKLDELENSNKNQMDKILGIVNLFEEPYKNKSFCLCGMFAAEFNELDEQGITVLNKFFDEMEQWIIKVITVDNKISNKEGKMYASIIVAALEGSLMLDRVKGKLDHLQAMKIWLKKLLA